MTEPKILRRDFQRALFRAGIATGGAVAGLAQTGCNPDEKRSDQSAAAESKKVPQASKVPLRIWIVGSVRQPETIVRQWAANSEQPIELRSLTIDSLFSQDKCAADVLFYPSRLLGQLEQRKWVVKLPNELSKLAGLEQASGSPSEDSLPAPAGLVAASKYDGVAYGIPLGYSMVSLLGSKSIDRTSLSWPEVLEALAGVERKALMLDESRVDRNALIDRFLFLALGATKSNAKYGVLFDAHTMNARLNATEFLFAAELIRALACQPKALASVIGSHTDAWQWVNQTDQAGFALLSPCQLSEEDGSLDAAQLVSLVGSKASIDGSGIMASITTQCQQTFQSTRFLEWIYQPRTQESLHHQVAGMLSIGSRGRNLLDRVVAANVAALQEDNIVSEPRMPGTELYRTALVEHLISIIRGARSCEEALTAACTSWDTITQEQLSNAKVDYAKSLGLRI